MFDFQREFMNFNYRELEVSLKDLFPKIDMKAVQDTFQYLKETDLHSTLYSVSRALWNGGYSSFLNDYGFWDEKNSTFTGKDFQCTPILGAVLSALGFEVSYLEGFRIREHFMITGIIDQMTASESQSELKQEFIRSRRIPSCILEVNIKGTQYYISGEQMKPVGNGTLALLMPECYQEFTGVFRHQDDASKSGIYVKGIIPKNNLAKANFSRRIVWMKQTSTDKDYELFCTFLRMKLV